ncbi:YbaB/EbfC family nucleoid-associated protein [Actinokineospora cianjurensis]|uniref:YbaB/EbfC DNA-binding family protein n=1 Tax=Actinokineospora cianjurensis TaxID=585224 RepID=A0A421B1C3_9PSEU|nr:YbaB/EbfC family nucleoid-associated protein [Actinokineospora cianjurensis]RLK58160.1 YbaB/EbfC DNA-binding family protein [Actinokineospora cianjurensis]
MDDRVLNTAVPMPEDHDAARQRLAGWQARAEQLAADTQAMGERFEQLRVTKTDPAGMAEVVVDSGGVLVGLTLTREIERAAPSVVAATIMSTIQAAKSDLADRARVILDDTLGPESPVARAIADQVTERLRGRPDPRRPGVDADEDNETRVFGRDDV